MDNFSVTNLRHLHYKRQWSNIFRITVIKQVIWDCITRLRMICATDFDAHAHQTHHAHCALGIFALNAHYRIFVNLKPVIRFYIT